MYHHRLTVLWRNQLPNIQACIIAGKRTKEGDLWGHLFGILQAASPTAPQVCVSSFIHY